MTPRLVLKWCAPVANKMRTMELQAGLSQKKGNRREQGILLVPVRGEESCLD
jgi:hypothetical protein